MKNRYFRKFSGNRMVKLNRLIIDSKLTRNKNNAVKERIKLINGGYQGSNKEYKETVLAYWKKYGLKPDKAYFSLYCDGKSEFDPRYITDPIWICYILPYFNDLTMYRAYDDKGMYHRLFPNATHPETVIKRMGGYYYNGDGERIITREEALKICYNESKLIFKPSLDSSRGMGILFFDRDKNSEQELIRIIDQMGLNFVAQRLVRQHPYLASLNESSLNTVRVITFHFKNEVHVLSAQLRIGGEDAKVDNVSAGGSAVAIKPDGFLYEKSVTRQSKWTYETAKGVKFSEIQVPNFKEIVEASKQLHCLLPHLNIIGWDFAVNENGTPVLIEFNVRPEQNQIGCGAPTFGDMTDDVLDEVFIKQSLKVNSKNR